MWLTPPRYGTVKEKEQTTFYMIIGFILGGIISTIVLSVRKFIKDSIEESRQKKLLVEKYGRGGQDQSLISTEGDTRS
jgi:uncharacterized membrane protein YedE/YeeE